jgi:glucose-1-phosphate cytidylyltransferase
MKTVLLAGGLGTRLAEETTLIPKPMVEIGVNLYAAQDVKNYFLNLCSVNNNLSNTRPATGTAGRILRLRTWTGDRVSNVDLRNLLAFRREHGKLATVTCVGPPAGFGGIQFNGDAVAEFEEKPAGGELIAWRRDGFWQAMDTLREKKPVEHLWESKKAPWKVWQ